MRLLVLLAAVAAGIVLQPSGVAAADESVQQQAFRCESEEDLDGSACRVDMLPDSALAEMVYERGFDPDGADRLQLLDAVMQLLDYEYATGEDLREMEYLPDDGSAAAAAETAAADLAAAAAPAAAAALAAEAEAAALAAAAGTGREAGLEEEHGAAGREDGDADSPAGVESGGAGNDGGEASDDAIAREVIEECTSSSVASSCPVGGRGEEVAAHDESTLLGYAHGLATEVLRTMRRDLNSLVGMLPEPVERPVREAAAFVGNTATRFVGPAVQKAERYTRGLRRGAGKTAGKAVVALKDEVLPRVWTGVSRAASNAKRRVEDAIAARKERSEQRREQQEQEEGRAQRD
ncbi:hypothetical protein Esi_0024_0181 [Ectocarpus siliculosus]|uniref:Uncharacterized protein n=1 Tax=Ectocarpus siliculosus TaxID=2880 RepID=D8LJB3_ECTSI|nr:hypothetical protein Esi_0024_0181 [Ectocarpus siliculosus]|eukprot:CBN76997.1 hypothetical protein Esi_0024_0181 [Ectocarpus siliculosus]